MVVQAVLLQLLSRPQQLPAAAAPAAAAFAALLCNAPLAQTAPRAAAAESELCTQSAAASTLCCLVAVSVASLLLQQILKSPHYRQHMVNNLLNGEWGQRCLLIGTKFLTSAVLS